MVLPGSFVAGLVVATDAATPLVEGCTVELEAWADVGLTVYDDDAVPWCRLETVAVEALEVGSIGLPAPAVTPATDR